MEKIALTIKKLKADATEPKYMTDAAAGMDIFSSNEEDILLQPGARTMVPTGIAIALPPGYEAQIRPRSGLAHKHGISIINTPGTIDADYRGEIKVLMINHGDKEFVITKDLRIAQMVINKVYRAEMVIAEDLDETTRGEGGFGHTGHN